MTDKNESVATPTPEQAVYLALRNAPMPDIVKRYSDAYDEVVELARQAGPYRIMMGSIERIFHERLIEKGGTHLPVGDERLEVFFEPGKSLEPVRNNQLLHELLVKLATSEGINLAEIEACVYLDKPKEPEWHSDLTQLKALAKKYGGEDGEVQKIINRCIERRRGPQKFNVIVKEAKRDNPSIT